MSHHQALVFRRILDIHLIRHWCLIIICPRFHPHSIRRFNEHYPSFPWSLMASVHLLSLPLSMYFNPTWVKCWKTTKKIIRCLLQQHQQKMVVVVVTSINLWSAFSFSSVVFLLFWQNISIYVCIHKRSICVFDWLNTTGAATVRFFCPRIYQKCVLITLENERACVLVERDAFNQWRK